MIDKNQRVLTRYSDSDSASGSAVSPGHGANSQLGPWRPTELPSGHIFASIVHATGSSLGGSGCVSCFFGHAVSESVSSKASGTAWRMSESLHEPRGDR